MIEEMLVDIAEQGYSSEDIKGAVIEVLQPFFDNIESLNQYACESQLLSAFEFFIRYHYESEFEHGVKSVLDCYKNAYREQEQELWNVVISTYSIIAEDDNKMWSVRNNKLDLNNNDMYEKMIQIFQRIGDVLEISVKHIVQEIYALVYLRDKGYVDYEKIKKQDLGVVINNVITKGILQPVLVTEPSGMKLSDWRNIAYHHTYSIDNTGGIKCTYGKENNNVIVLSMQELEKYVHKIIRSANALYIGRCIFLFDYIDSMPQNSAIETVNFRQNLCCEQFKIGLLSQEFMLGNVELSGEKIEIDIHDLSLDEEVGGRIIHCAQLLLNTWFTWKREEVSINYFAKSGERVCCVSVEGEICKEILEGKKEKAYLAEKFHIKKC